jgi:hypothetical protein
MALPIVIPVAIIGLLAIVTYEAGVTLQAMYVRDAVVKTKEADVAVQESQDNTINDIIDNSSLTPSQKTEAIKQYLGLQEDKTGDKITEILPWILALVIVIFVAYFIVTNKKR